MKKALLLFIAFLLILLPIIGRYVSFYQGSYQRVAAVEVPDYAALQAPQPVRSTPALLPNQMQEVTPVVVIDLNHANNVTLAEIEPLINDLVTLGARVEVNTGSRYLADVLKYASAYVAIVPTQLFYEEDVNELRRFVERGGKLLVISDPTRKDSYSYTGYTSTEVGNQLLAPYGIAFADDYVYNVVKNEGNFRNVILEGFLHHAVTAGLTEVVFYSAQSFARAPFALVRGDTNTLSSLTDEGGNLPLIAMSADERVLALGDMTFMTTPYIQVLDNQRLVANLAAFLAGSARLRQLTDMPYLFTRPVALRFAEDFAEEETRLSMFSNLQATLRLLDLPLSRSDGQDLGRDVILLARVPPDEEILPYLEAVGIEFSASNEAEYDYTITPTPTPFDTWDWEEPAGDRITLPGIGALPVEGVGLVVYASTAERNILLVLAKSSAGALELLNQVMSGSLYGCLIAPAFALCPVYAMDDGDDWDDWGGWDGGGFYDTPTPYPGDFDLTPTPTAVGR